MINRSYRHSRDLLLVQLNQQILKKDSALQRVFRVVNQEVEKLDSPLCDGSSQ
jgi:hypothetical protein